MEKSKILLWALVIVAAGIIVWRVGFHTNESPLMPGVQKAGAQPSRAAPRGSGDSGAADDAGAEQPSEAAEPEQDEESARAADANEPNQPADEGAKAGEPEEPEDPNNPMEAVNLKNVEMKNIIDKIAHWTGKTVIPDDEAMKLKLTIYAPKKLPRNKALETIYSALRMKGFVAEEVDDKIFLKPLKEARLGLLPTVSADEPLALFENKDQVVQKFFKLTSYPPAKMAEVIQPLVGEYGHVGADEATGSLLVIETVANLMRIESVIKQFDVPEAEQVVEEFFTIKHGDPVEIVQLLRMLMGESPRGSRGGSYRGRGSSSGSSASRGGPPSKGGSGGAATSVVISTGDIPIVLIPVPERKWVIARGSAEDIEQIRGWIAKLDLSEPVQSEVETVSIMYASPREVADRIEEALEDLSGTDFRPSVLVREIEQSRQIMIFGRADLRDMVKKLIAEIDVPAGTFEEKTFDLEHADAEQIKQNIDNLYGDEQDSSNRYNYYYWRYGRGDQSPSDRVKVIAFPTMGQVTVIASPENMRKIEQQIEEWDVPLDVDAVKPRIIELKNSDPVQMTELLTKLFTEESDSSASLWRIFWWDEDVTERKKIVGPLYGQLTFEDLPGTKKIIVISKIPQAYDVIEELIYELDRQEMGEVPEVMQLKYADPEDLSERLNATFNEPGTTAPIRRSTRGLSAYSMDDSEGNQNQGGNQSGSGGTSSAAEYTPPWSRGGGRRPDEEPISNVIGRVRFIPDPRSKSILVLAPPEFQANIRKTIEILDVPGRQVMIKAVVMTIDHEDLTSLGLQFASDPAAFGALSENSLTAFNSLSTWAERGSFSFQGDMNVSVLVDFLIKKTNARVLNEQTVWTKDNEEATFFRGDKVGFVSSTNFSPEGRITGQNVDFDRVGMTLRARPSITPEKNVDMIINVILSQLTNDLVNTQPVRTEMETTTNMIVADGETIMLGGMLFQRNEAIQRKLPLLGDLPLAGVLFRHYENVLANKELIVFITPYVVSDGKALSEKARQQMEETRQKLDDMKKGLNEDTDRLKGDVKDIKAQADPAPANPPADRPKKRLPEPKQPATTVASSKRPMPIDAVWR